MSPNQAVHPSEIIHSKKPKKKRKIAPDQKNVWLRFLARMFDYSILSCLFSIFIITKIWDRASLDFALPLELFVWIFIEAFFLSKLRATPGKFLLRFKVIAPKKFTYELALKRSFMVWMRGMGLGLYFLPFFTMFYAYSKLINRKITSWDRDLHLEVHHKKCPAYRVIFCILFIVFVFFLGRFY